MKNLNLSYLNISFRVGQVVDVVVVVVADVVVIAETPFL